MKLEKIVNRIGTVGGVIIGFLIAGNVFGHFYDHYFDEDEPIIMSPFALGFIYLKIFAGTSAVFLFFFLAVKEFFYWVVGFFKWLTAKKKP